MLNKQQLTEDAKQIFGKQAFAHVALVDEKGRPHVSPVWIDVDEKGRVVFNTAEGRVKSRIIREGTPIAISATDPDNPYKVVFVRGRVVERTHEGADDVIDRLAKKYLGKDKYPYRQPGEQRVTVVVEPEHVAV